MRKQLLLVFGTSADPLHEGHVELIVDAVKALTARGWNVAAIRSCGSPWTVFRGFRGSLHRAG